MKKTGKILSILFITMFVVLSFNASIVHAETYDDTKTSSYKTNNEVVNIILMVWNIYMQLV